ncbi:ribonuclease H-like domain-containing protein, partial [Tanacetum coccineum]
NRDFIEFCRSKGIKREYSNARTPQQNGVAERKNMTLIEDARTMLADSFLPNTFWAEVVSTSCYVLNMTEPSPRPSLTTHIPDSIPKGSGGNHGGQSSSDRSLSWNEGGMTLQSMYDLCISLCTQGRKPAKAEPTVHKDPAFDELDDDTMDYMETKDAQDVGRTSYVVHEEKESAKKGVSTKDPLSIAQPKVSTDKPEDSTDKPDEGTNKPKVSTDKEEVSTDRPDEGNIDQHEGRSATQTAPTTSTPTTFGDDETIAQVLIIMSQNKEKLKEKEKGVELKDVEETERPRPTSTRSLLTLKPLTKIDPKDKGKNVTPPKMCHSGSMSGGVTS